MDESFTKYFLVNIYNIFLVLIQAQFLKVGQSDGNKKKNNFNINTINKILK